MTIASVAAALGKSVAEVTKYQDLDTHVTAHDLAISLREAETIGALGVALTVPGAPTIGAATIVDTTHVSVTFTAPASDGGDEITHYTVTSSVGGFTASGTNGSPIVVPGAFVTATGYTFTVTATNGQGTGAASLASNSVTPNP